MDGLVLAVRAGGAVGSRARKKSRQGRARPKRVGARMDEVRLPEGEALDAEEARVTVPACSDAS